MKDSSTSLRMTNYRGRIAPSPTGYLHVGHAMTFWRAQERTRAANGKLILRIEDLDAGRCRSEFRDAILVDVSWFGLQWDEGPFFQSERCAHYATALQKLRDAGLVYPCRCSRKDVAEAGLAPHGENDEPIYPGTCRPGASALLPPGTAAATNAAGVNWRFRVPDAAEIAFADGRLGEQRAIAGKDFGDFIVWRRDGTPAYQLAVVVDDAAMKITEVVRGEDLLTSTFRQLLIYRALGLKPPRFYHAPLVKDKHGRRLAKRDAAMSLRGLRQRGVMPEEVRASTALIVE